MTYSVIAFDPESGAFGVAVQSHWFNVGRTAPWVRFGVGAVFTHALTDLSYGLRGLDAMSYGVPTGDSLGRLLSDDSEGVRRQAACVDSNGWTAGYTRP